MRINSAGPRGKRLAELADVFGDPASSLTDLQAALDELTDTFGVDTVRVAIERAATRNPEGVRLVLRRAG